MRRFALFASLLLGCGGSSRDNTATTTNEGWNPVAQLAVSGEALSPTGATAPTFGVVLSDNAEQSCASVRTAYPSTNLIAFNIAAATGSYTIGESATAELVSTTSTCSAASPATASAGVITVTSVSPRLSGSYSLVFVGETSPYAGSFNAELCGDDHAEAGAAATCANP